MPEGFSTDSYPKAPLPVSPLDIAGKVGGLVQQKLAIDQAKLDQANQGLTYMVRAMGSVGPGKSVDDYLAVGRNAVQMGLVPENMFHIYEQRMKASADPYREFMSAAQQGLQQIQMHTGVNTDKTNNASQSQGKTDIVTGGYKPTTEFDNQLIPGTEYYQGGQKKILGPAGPAGVRQSLPVAPMAPLAPTSPVAGSAGAVPPPDASAPMVPRRMPVERTSGPSGDTVRRKDMEAGAPAGARGTGLNAAAPPMFDEGKKMMVRDQEVATAKATSLKPLEEAYDLAKSVATGPGTESLNKARAYLFNLGLIKATEKDPTVIYPMLNKNLAQFVDKSGSRSDADLAVKESGNANAKTQIQPALLHMVQKIIGRERMEIARPSAFQGTEYQKYGEHSSGFPTNQDERAYTIDKMPASEGRKLYNDMKDKALNGKTSAERAEGIKFLRSLSTARQTKQVNGLGQ